jgi:hypothetical protein
VSICKPLCALAMALLFGVPLAHCDLSGSCLRFSDCNDGLTCAAGKCVPPPADGGVEDGASADAPPPAADVTVAPPVAPPASCDDAGGAACDDGSGGEGGSTQASTDATAE